MGKSYDINTLTIDEMKELIANGDDSHDNQIRVTKSGQIYLSQDVVGAEQVHDLQFRFETIDAGGDWIGPNAASDEKWINRLFTAAQKHWKEKKSTYIDSY